MGVQFLFHHTGTYSFQHARSVQLLIFSTVFLLLPSVIRPSHSCVPEQMPYMLMLPFYIIINCGFISNFMPSMCMCVYACWCVLCTGVYVWVWVLGDNFELTLRNNLYLLWDNVSPWHWDCQSGQSCQPGTPKMSSPSPGIGITSTYIHAWHFYVVSRDQTLVLGLARQMLESLAESSPQSPFSLLKLSLQENSFYYCSITYGPLLWGHCNSLLCWHPGWPHACFG